MKRIYCELHLFDLNQTIYIVDAATGHREKIAVATMEELPEVINAISDSKHIKKIWLTGNSILGHAVSEDIITYGKMHYSENELEVEVLK